MSLCARVTAIFGGILFLAAPAAHAQQEFPPPQGKGRVVVVISGATGEARYESVAGQIARLGYDAILFDYRDTKGTEEAALRGIIQQFLNDRFPG